MGERIRDDITLGLSLQSVVANCRRRLHCSFDVAGFNKLPFRLRPVCPNTGKTIRLQLDPNLQAVGFSLAHPALRLLHLGKQSEQILYVVADLVRDHIGLRELTGLAANVTGAEPSLKILKEACIEVDLLIQRAIKRTHSRLLKSAA